MNNEVERNILIPLNEAFYFPFQSHVVQLFPFPIKPVKHTHVYSWEEREKWKQDLSAFSWFMTPFSSLSLLKFLRRKFYDKYLLLKPIISRENPNLEPLWIFQQTFQFSQILSFRKISSHLTGHYNHDSPADPKSWKANGISIFYLGISNWTNSQ